MDIATQAILGASLAQSSASKEHIRYACLIGLFSGVLADVDVFIRSDDDPLLFLEYHRHFSHSIIFIPIGAFIASLFLWPLFRKYLSIGYIYFYSFIGYSLSGFIDACTSYGTHLLWPFSDDRIAWHVISIVDPIFTLILFLTLVLGFKKLDSNYSRFGLCLALAYLILAFTQLNRAEDEIYKQAEARNHEIEKIVVKPTFGNILLWRSVYLSGSTFYIDAIRLGIDKKLYPGASLEKFGQQDLAVHVEKNTTLMTDIQRFQFFSDDYIAFHPGDKNVLGDVRYSLNPISNIPLWGIRLDFTKPEQHVKYEVYRKTSKELREQFIAMLLGEDL